MLLGYQMGHHYPFFSPWSEFIIGLSQVLKVSVKLDDPGVQSIKTLLSTVALTILYCLSLFPSKLNPLFFQQPLNIRT